MIMIMIMIMTTMRTVSNVFFDVDLLLSALQYLMTLIFVIHCLQTSPRVIAYLFRYLDETFSIAFGCHFPPFLLLRSHPNDDENIVEWSRRTEFVEYIFGCL